jgi:hypothetical protein
MGLSLQRGPLSPGVIGRFLVSEALPKRLSSTLSTGSPEIQPRGSGVDIRGMRERFLQLSGTISIESDRSETRINGVIPIPKIESREKRPAPAMNSCKQQSYSFRRITLLP